MEPLRPIPPAAVRTRTGAGTCLTAYVDTSTTSLLTRQEFLLIYFQISEHNALMPRRRPGSLLPLEISILFACCDAGQSGTHGFLIARTIADADESRRLTATGTLYRALHRLDEAGLVENWWEDPGVAAEAGRPRRRMYRITAAGSTALARAETDIRVAAMNRVEPGYLT